MGFWSLCNMKRWSFNGWVVIRDLTTSPESVFQHFQPWGKGCMILPSLGQCTNVYCNLKEAGVSTGASYKAKVLPFHPADTHSVKWLNCRETPCPVCFFPSCTYTLCNLPNSFLELQQTLLHLHYPLYLHFFTARGLSPFSPRGIRAVR